MGRMLRCRLRTLFSIGALLSLRALATDADAEPGRPEHHRPGGFQNRYSEFEPKGLAALIRWRLDAARAGLPKPPATPTPTVAPDLAFLRANAQAGMRMQPAVTWIGHASMLLQAGGLTVLTDPIFSARA